MSSAVPDCAVPVPLTRTGQRKGVDEDGRGGDRAHQDDDGSVNRTGSVYTGRRARTSPSGHPKPVNWFVTIPTW